uniref:ORF132 n=2 Tax=Lymantria dispar multicapsid nuclear polyhedrosis virus TaxID=10449 RepID=A0A2S1XBL0_NPVLD|nr:ORF134 [Lymantria dispar multiple nucleopolyhedrovirus]QDH05977.1 ORF132 [Lymantria dispar multiple nucleopolyhedrovirus]QIT08181.1 hypothetical protein [Lymantria dispar multiple nucleopolyhedrovirus]
MRSAVGRAGPGRGSVGGHQKSAVHVARMPGRVVGLADIRAHHRAGVSVRARGGFGVDARRAVRAHGTLEEHSHGPDEQAGVQQRRDARHVQIFEGSGLAQETVVASTASAWSVSHRPSKKAGSSFCMSARTLLSRARNSPSAAKSLPST